MGFVIFAILLTFSKPIGICLGSKHIAYRLRQSAFTSSCKQHLGSETYLYTHCCHGPRMCWHDGKLGWQGRQAGPAAVTWWWSCDSL